MTQKHVNIVAAAIFIIVAALFIISRMGIGSLQKNIQNLQIEDISSASIYREGMVDSDGLTISLTDKDDLQALVNCMTGMKKSGTSVKSYTITEDVRIRLSIMTDKQQPIELHVMRMEELGDQVLIRISIIKNNGFAEGGLYSSDEFSPWLRNLSNRAEYEGLWE